MFISPRFLFSAKIALTSTACLLPSQAMAYRYIDPSVFSISASPQILRQLGANDSLLKVHSVAHNKMSQILQSEMVQRMAKGTLSKEEWDKKYMRADALYIYNLGKALALRATREKEKDALYLKEISEMFLGYGKHFERLKKYGLSEKDILVSPECNQHIAFLSRQTSMPQFYFAILTDMIPYVVFSNYLLQSIEPNDQNPWLEYAKKYGDLNNKYAKEKLGKTIRIANEILTYKKMDRSTAEKIFHHGFSFEEWFIRNAFTTGFNIQSSPDHFR